MRTTPSAIRLASAAMLIAMTACGTGKQTEVPKDQKDPTEADPIVITFHGEGDGRCLAKVDPQMRMAKRGQWLKWAVSQVGCNDFTFSKVKIVHDDNFVKTKESHVIDGTVYISAKISRDKTDAGDAPHTYSVYFGDSKAADPEVDVMGDCNGCQVP